MTTNAANAAPTIAGVPASPAVVTTGLAAALADFAIADGDDDSLTVTLKSVNGSIGNVTDANAILAGVQLSGTAAGINAALTDATFTATASGAASIGISVSDGKATPATATYSFLANAAPTIAGVPATTAVVTTGLAAALANFTVADKNNDNLTVTLTAANGNIGNVKDTNPELDGIQLTGTAAGINTALAAATFIATSSGAASIGISVTDGKAAPATATYNLAANAAPTIAGVPATPAIVTTGMASALADFAIADSNDDNLTVTLKTVNGSIGNVTDANATLAGIQLSGTAAGINAALAAATFTATASGAASIGISVSDGKAPPATASYSFLGNAAPTIAGVPATTALVTTGLAAALPNFTVADKNNDNLTVSLTAANGNIGNVKDINPELDGIQLTGTAAGINTALAAATFIATSSGAASIGISVTDGKATPATATYNLVANAAPTIADVPATPAIVTTGMASALADFAIADSNDDNLTVTLKTVNGSIGNVADANAALAGIQLSGTAAGINAALADATFTATANGAASIGISVSDGKATPATASYSFLANAAPTIAGVPATAALVTTGLAAALANFTVADGNNDNLTVTLTAANGSVGNVNDANLDLDGIQLTGTAAGINTALAAATFTATSSGAASIGISVTDGKATPASATYNLVANAAPTISGVPATPAVVTTGLASALADFAVTDSDDDNLTVTLKSVNGSIGNVADANTTLAGIQLSGTAAGINAALADATFTATASGAASIGISVSDGKATPATASYSFLANAAPTIAGVPATAATPALVTTGLAAALADFTVSDSNNDNLTVTLTAANGSVGNVNDANLDLDGIQLTGTAAGINTALAAATFIATSSGPASIGISVTDGKTTPATATYNLAANAAATISGVPATPAVVTTGLPSALADFAIADSDDDNLTVTLKSVNGSIGNVTDANTTLAGIQLSGTAAGINAALADATFTATASGAASIGISVSDGKATPATASYSFLANAAPTIAGVPAAPAAVTTGLAAALANFTVADGNNDNLTVTLTAANGNIGNVKDTNPELDGIQLTGTAAGINTVLAAATFTASASGPASIGISVTDGKATPASATYSFLVNAAPTIVGVPATATVVTTGLASALADFAIADSDDDNLTVTLKSVNGSIGNVADANTTLAGIQLSGTTVDINAALAAATFTATASGAASIGISVSDGKATPATATYSLTATKQLNDNVINGTSASETLRGTDARDFISAGAGNDTIFGSRDNDTVDGGSGFDTYLVSSNVATDPGHGKLSFVTDSDGAVRVQGLVNGSATPLLTLKAASNGALTVTGLNGVADQGVDTVSNVECFSIYNWHVDSVTKTNHYSTFTLIPSLTVSLLNGNEIYGGGDINVTQAFASKLGTLYSTDWINIYDDSRSGVITGSVAQDNLNWHGGNDSFDGGAGIDNARLYYGVSYGTGVTLATDSGGNTLFKDGDIMLMSVSATDSSGHSTVTYQGDTLSLKDVETFSFYAYPQGGGTGKSYTLNLGSSVDLGSKHLTVGAGVADVTGALSEVALSQYDYVRIDDDSRVSVITGSVAQDDLTWHGGNDSFDGGAGIDNARLYYGIGYGTGITVDTDSSGNTVFKDGDTTLMSVSATDSSGHATVTYQDDTLHLKDVETLSFYVYPQGGGAGKNYALNLGSSVDLDSKHLTVGAGVANVTSALSGVALTPSDHVRIDDDSRISIITGSVAQDNLTWHGGSDSFDGGAGIDNARLSDSVRYSAGITFATDSSGNTQFMDGDTTLMSVSAMDSSGHATVTYQGDTLNLKDVETFSFYAYQQGGGAGKNYALNLGNSVNLDSKQLTVGAGVANVTSALSEVALTQYDYVRIDDDSRASAISGSVARDHLTWHGGSDSFDGGAGTDNVRLYDSVRYSAGLTFATDSSGNTLVKDGDTTLMEIGATDGSGHATVTYQGDTLNLKDVETFSFSAYRPNGSAGKNCTLNLVTVVDLDNRHLTIGTGVADVASLLSGASLDQYNYVNINDDSRASAITGSVAADTLNWHGGNDSFDGGAGIDDVHLYDGISCSSGIAFANDSSGNTLFKDGDTILLSVSATDSSGHATVTYQGDTLNLKDVETFSFYAYPQGGGAGKSYALNLGNSVDLDSKQLTVGAGVTDVASTLSGVELSQYDYVTIDDDSRASAITGSVAQDNLNWHGGSDSFDGGAGIDSVRLYDSVRYSTGISFSTDSSGNTLVKDGDTTLISVSAADGHAALTHQGDTLTLKDVETLSFHAYPQGGGMAKNYTLNLGNSVDLGSNHLSVGTGLADVTSLLSGLNLDRYNYVHIDDDSLASAITGSAAQDNLYWHGGNDSFDGGAGVDNVDLYNGISYSTGITFATDGSGNTLVKDGDTTLMSISATDGSGRSTITCQGDTLNLKDVETFSFYVYPQNGGMSKGYELNLVNFVDLDSNHLSVAAGVANVTALLSGVDLSATVRIDDDSRDSIINGSMAQDLLSWHGGNDVFIGGGGIDTLFLADDSSMGSEIFQSSVLDSSFTLSSYGGVIATVSNTPDGIIVDWTGYGHITLVGIQFLELNAYSSNPQTIDLSSVFG